MLIALGSFFTASGQGFCPVNINLEQGNLNGWTFATALNAGALGLRGLRTGSPITGRQTITSGTATDLYGGFPIVDPVGGTYSLRVGNDQVGAEVDRASYTFTVPATMNNNYSLIYRYAVVFENPAHAATEQPTFKVRVYDSATGAIINCASFTYVSGGSLPGFSVSSRTGAAGGAIVYYKPWATASLNLSGQSGKTLVIEFTAADCSLGAHMGYGYVDVSCGLFAISSSTCNATSPLTAPPGFQTYTWYNSNFTSVVGTGQSITVPTPNVKTKYNVVLTPYSGYGCQDTLTTEIFGSSLALNAGPDTMVCNAAAVTLNPTVTGNSGPYTYSWTPSTSLSCSTCKNPAASPAVTTDYVVTVTDTIGCTRRDTIQVKPAPAVTASASPAACFGAANGVLSATASKGTAPFSYSWNTTPAATTANANNITAGTYTVTATDAKGCIATAQATVTQAPRLTAAIGSTDNVSCNGSADGRATVTATGGVAPYTYNWNTTPAKTGATATLLAAGTYTVTVTDSMGCTDTKTVTITQPAALSMNLQKTLPTCAGTSNGSVSITGAGGTAPYSYAIGNGAFSAANSFANLAAGSYTIHMRDSRSCVLDSIVTIAQPAPVVLSWTSTQPLCNGAANGLISMNATGGSAPYQYAVGTGSFGTSNQAANLGAGSYAIHVRDAAGCQADSTVVLNQPQALSLNLTSIQINCHGGTGSVSGSANGGTTPYQFSIDNGAFGSSAQFNGLSAGAHVLHLRDAAGCTKDSSFSIAQPTALAMSLNTTAPACYGAANGQIQISATGGTSAYQYALNNGAFGSSNSFGSLQAGAYAIHLRDAAGCTLDSNVQIQQPAAIAASINVTPMACASASNASISVAATGGTAPYSYAINTGGFGSASSFTGLAAGTHIVHIRDARSCLLDSTIVITQPAALRMSWTATQPLCTGAANGQITISPIGGAAPYQYAINSGSYGASAQASNLAAGSYVLHVRDAAGCQSDSMVTLAQPLALSLGLSATHNVCYGTTSGAALATATGGTAPYQYALNAGAFGSSAQFGALAAGTYTLHLRDASGCTKDSTFSITQPAALAMSFTNAAPACSGSASGQILVAATGGSSTYQYAINNGAFGNSPAFNNLPAGTHIVHLRDLTGCTLDSTIQLQQPGSLSATATTTAVSCFGGNNGAIQINAAGGTAPYSYSWNGTAATGATAGNLSAGTYTATVSDSKGCIVSVSSTVAQPANIGANVSTTAPACNGGNTGSATAVVTGGTAPYSYSWSGASQTGATVNTLASGSYTLTVTDAASCSVTFPLTVPATPAAQISVTGVNPACYGGRDGKAIVTMSNAAGPYTYNWQGLSAQNGDTARGLSAGTYNVTVTTAAGCTATGSVTLTNPQRINISVTSKGTCNTSAMGSLTAIATGGVAPYQYQWNTVPSLPSATASGLTPGLYRIVVTDHLNCKDSATGLVPAQSGISIEAKASKDTVCKGAQVQLSATGAASYSWSPANLVSCATCAVPFASPVKDTLFTVIGTDSAGCRDTAFVRVSVMQRVPVRVAENTKVCQGGTATLQSFGGISRVWLTANKETENAIQVAPQETTTYGVAITENSCYTDTLYQQVEVLPTPTVEVGEDVEAAVGTEVTLHAKMENANRITWMPSQGLSCSECNDPVHRVAGKAIYVARVSNELGCTATDTMRISDVCDEKFYFFANMFSPNADGNNDRFYPQGPGNSRIDHFMIYDRWGEVVFAARNISVNDPAAGWDGTFRSQQLKSDVYVYVMDAVCENGKKIVVRGDVTLVR
jgi:gliding motility-associated-like protein